MAASIACGTTGAVIELPDVDAQPDGSNQTTAPAASATVAPWEPCTPGNERIVLTANGSVHVLRRSICAAGYEAGLPGAMVFSGSEDGPIIFTITGCDDAGAFSTWAETPFQSLDFNSDLWADASMMTDLRYGALDTRGTITVDDWPDAGGLFTGSFAGSDPKANPPASLSGTFCVERGP